MTTTTRVPTTTPVPSSPHRRTALVVGVLFLVTYVTSIPAKFALYTPLFDDADYVLGSGEDSRVLWGAVAEMVLIVANIGTAVALNPDGARG